MSADQPEIPDTPWRKARANQRSQRQEGALAARPGGRRQLNSGRLWFAKRDVTLNGYLIEARTTENATYTISKVEFKKLVKDAFSTPPGQLPAMVVTFEGGDPINLFVTRLEDHEAQQERIGLLEGELEKARVEIERLSRGK